MLHIGFLHHFKELPRIGGQRFHIAPLPLGIDRVEREAGFSAARQAGNHDQLIARQIDIDPFKVMLARTAHFDVGQGHGKACSIFVRRAQESAVFATACGPRERGFQARVFAGGVIGVTSRGLRTELVWIYNEWRFIMKRLLLPLALSAANLSGCATFSPLTSHQYIGDRSGQWLTYDSTRRGTLIVTSPDGEIRSCSEPAPDTAYNFSNAVKANVETGGTTAGADISLAATIAELAGRDNLVLLARDAMYRLCEASANGMINSQQYSDLYKQVLAQVSNIATASTARSESVSKILQRGLK